jgi:hypothetical protein
MIEWLRAHPDTGIARTLLPLLGGDDDDDPPDAGAAVLAA